LLELLYLFRGGGPSAALSPVIVIVAVIVLGQKAAGSQAQGGGADRYQPLVHFHDIDLFCSAVILTKAHGRTLTPSRTACPNAMQAMCQREMP
jgi:hypothetical protein